MKKLLIIPTVIASILLLTVSISARPSIEYQSSMLWSGSEDVLVDEANYAYCLLANGLEIYDVSNLAVPIKVASLYVPGGKAMCKSGRYIYLAAGESGMAVIDVISPRFPDLVLYVPTPGDARDVFYHAGRNQIYLADYDSHSNSGLLVYQITNSARPTLIFEYLDNYVESVFGLDSLAYIYGQSHNLSIVDIDSESEVGIIPGTSSFVSAKRVVVRDTVAFVVWYRDYPNREGYLETWNVADPAVPVWMDSVGIGSGFPGSFGDLIVDGNLAYANSNSLSIVDVSNPAQLSKTGELSGIGSLSGIFLHLSFVYGVPDRYGGIAAIYVIDPANPRLFNSFDITYQVNGVYEKNGFLYVATERNGLHVYDVDDPKDPIQVGMAPLINQWGNSAFMKDVYIKGDLALVSGHETFILNVSDPAAPDSLGVINTSASPYAMQIVDTLAYLAVNGPVWIVDIADPANPHILIKHNIGSTTTDLYVRDNMMYLANEDGFFIVDVSDPLNPVELGSFLTEEYAESIAIQDDLAYVSFSDFNPSAIYFFDISDPEHPDTVSSISDAWGDLEIQDSMLYVNGASSKLSIFNVKDPAAPVLADSYETPGYRGRVFVRDDIVYLADVYSAMLLKTPYGGVSTAVVEDRGVLPLRFDLSQNYPNPFNPSTVIDFDMPVRSRVTIDLFNTTGQKVRTLVDEIKPAGSYRVRWDGTNGNGVKVATGVYFYRLTVGDNSVTKKMVLIK
ncbi:MAG: T9SS type A sorting domain-containing protein [Candidatus Zixiibacteriota bacterium]